MIFSLTARCVLTMKHQKGQLKSSHVSTDFNIDVSANLDRKEYLTSDGLPTKMGSQTLTQCFVQGLVANMHMAHQEGFRDSAEHLRYIITELERGFATVADTYKSTFDDDPENNDHERKHN